MDAGLIIGIVYATIAVITMIVYDVRNYKQNKKRNSETTFWDSILENGQSVGASAVWPITLPFLLKEIILDEGDTPTIESKAEPIMDVANRKTFTVEELKTLPLRAWVWIEVLEPLDYEEKVSAYYRKQMDYTHKKAFCCGYPGLSFSFYYEDYGKTWIAYQYQPKE